MTLQATGNHAPAWRVHIVKKIICLLSIPVALAAYAGWIKKETLSVSGTSTTSAQLSSGVRHFMVCDVAIYMRSCSTSSCTATTSITTDFPIAALEKFPFVPDNQSKYIGAITTGASGSCLINVSGSTDPIIFGQAPSFLDSSTDAGIHNLTADVISARLFDGGVAALSSATVRGVISAITLDGGSIRGTTLSLSGNTVSSGSAQFNGAGSFGSVAAGSVSATVLESPDQDIGECAVTIPAGSFFCGAGDNTHNLSWGGSAWLADGVAISLVVPVDWTFGAYSSRLTGTGTLTAGAATSYASTVQAVTWTPQVVGVGVGNFVSKLCDNTTCSGTTFATCTAGCAAAAGTAVSCTINTASVPKSTTPYWQITTACATTNAQGNYVAHLSQP